jgi:ElaB/YqjD/DUF883 family membrane-anchored ribosome-binding protein
MDVVGSSHYSEQELRDLVSDSVEALEARNVEGVDTPRRVVAHDEDLGPRGERASYDAFMDQLDVYGSVEDDMRLTERFDLDRDLMGQSYIEHELVHLAEDRLSIGQADEEVYDKIDHLTEVYDKARGVMEDGDIPVGDAEKVFIPEDPEMFNEETVRRLAAVDVAGLDSFQEIYEEAEDELSEFDEMRRNASRSELEEIREKGAEVLKDANENMEDLKDEYSDEIDEEYGDVIDWFFEAHESDSDTMGEVYTHFWQASRLGFLDDMDAANFYANKVFREGYRADDVDVGDKAEDLFRKFSASHVKKRQKGMNRDEIVEDVMDTMTKFF